MAMNAQIRGVRQVVEPVFVREGAGVKLRRSIGLRTLDYLDPFLLLDHFASDDPADYLAGFPWHPHRGIETVTYMLAGTVKHRDSIGNAGSIGAGDAQWMTAGGGIMHEEMPQPVNGRNAGFQLWVNLPAKDKMIAPRYQDIPAASIPEVVRPDGTKIRVIAGSADGARGPVGDIIADPTYLDVAMPAGVVFQQSVTRGHTAFAYLFEGSAGFGPEGSLQRAPEPRLVVFENGDAVRVESGDRPARFLLISGKPLGEPIARYGPFVMTTQAEIQQALRDLREGTFVR
jgi:redox-sensitive bicupin YhaK (pirin superfamily)